MSQMETSLTDVNLPVKRVTGDTMKDRMTSNAYDNILPARYLIKNQDGEPIEDQEEIFHRVAKNIALAEVVYEADKHDTTVMVEPKMVKDNHSRRDELVEEVFDTSAYLQDGELVVENPDETVPLTEDNVYNFSFDNVVPEIEDDEIRESVIDVKDEFTDMMEHLSFMPNSPTIMNAGDELQQLSACFVRSPADDIGDIHETAKEAAEIFQSGGGLGYAFWRLRPYGDPVGSTGGIASGPITFMETFDQMCETIAQGGTRRGAQMGIMKVTHPDVIQFIHSKNKDVSLAHTLRLNDPDDYTHTSFIDALDEARELIDEEGRVPKHLRNAVEGHLSNFNISVGATSEFMEAAMNDESWTLLNPQTGEPHIATEETKELYSRFGLGEYVTVGEELSVPAKELYDRIVSGMYENGEPGLVFLDKMNEDHSYPVETTPTGNGSKYEILATNPCGEQPLMEYESCNLGHINLSTIVDKDCPDWRKWSKESGHGSLEEQVDEFLDLAIDWDELSHRIEYATRFLENVVTMSKFPIEKIEEVVSNNRKVGLGIMGLAQMYIQMGVKYGSTEANEIARQLMREINQQSKRVSHKLAQERGSFENWDDSKWSDPTEYSDWFQRMTGLDPAEYEDGFEIRNHNTTTIAPTGTTSMLGDTTGGCEPIYSVARYKNVSEDVQGDELLVQFDDYFLRTLEENNIDVDEVKREAQEQMANNEFEGIEGLDTVPNELGELFVVTSDLTVLQHCAVQCALQEGVDSAISKTINAPNDSTKQDARDAIEYVYENGGKGFTYYRDATRSKQVLTTRADNKEFSDGENDGELLQIIEERLQEEDSEEFATQVADLLSTTNESFNDPENVVEAFFEEPENLSLFDESQYAEKRERPDVLVGATQRIETGYGKLYVVINESQATGEPFEIFVEIGNSGGFTSSFTEALAKVASSALRSGVDPYEIAEDLTGIRSPKIAWDKGEKIQSIPDAIGTALRRHLNDEIESTADEQINQDSIEQNESTSETENSEKTSVVERGESPECPECEEMALVYSEGCKTCESCGWSEC